MDDLIQEQKESQIENLIKYLAYILEYDENYYVALTTVNLERSIDRYYQLFKQNIRNREE